MTDSSVTRSAQLVGAGIARCLGHESPTMVLMSEVPSVVWIRFRSSVIA
jgi:hypothetical protein